MASTSASEDLLGAGALYEVVVLRAGAEPPPMAATRASTSSTDWLDLVGAGALYEGALYEGAELRAGAEPPPMAATRASTSSTDSLDLVGAEALYEGAL